MISETERNFRQKAIQFARGSVRLEGCTLDPEIERLNDEFIAGNLTPEEHTRACLALTASAPDRRQAA